LYWDSDDSNGVEFQPCAKCIAHWKQSS
jgi:hypothetical protein